MAYCGPRGIPHSEFLAWSLDDQTKALGWVAEESHRCNQCGTADWEWEADRRAYVAEPYVCLGCLALRSTEKSHAKEAEGNPGLHVRLVRNGGHDGGTP